MSLRTWIYTLVNGALVGRDEFGNRYFRGKGRKLNGRERRWVIYKGETEASGVPPEWHAWLHHTVDVPLTEEAAKAPTWHKTHEPNLTGTLVPPPCSRNSIGKSKYFPNKSRKIFSE